jgi:Cytidylate kinase-like family
MAVWTISAQAGTCGDEIARELARRADVAFLDREALAPVAHELEPDLGDADELEERLSGRFAALALGAAIASGAPEAVREFQLRRTLPELGRAVLREAAREPAVIFAPAAFAALQDHPSAIHVRLRAPFEWRVAACQRENVVDRHAAEKSVHHDDDHKRAWVRTLYHVDVDDPTLFSLVVDVSRFARERVVETLLAAAGLPTSQ